MSYHPDWALPCSDGPRGAVRRSLPAFSTNIVVPAWSRYLGKRTRPSRDQNRDCHHQIWSKNATPVPLMPSINGFNKVATNSDGSVDLWFGSSKPANARADAISWWRCGSTAAAISAH